MDNTILRRINIMLKHRSLHLSVQSGMLMVKTPAKVFEIQPIRMENRNEEENEDEHKTTSVTPAALLFLATESLGKSDIKNILTFSNTVSHIIIYGHVSLQAKILLEESTAFCEVITATDIVFDKCASVLVPTYRVIPPKDVRTMLKSRCISIDSLPKMKRHDAMARYLGFRTGTVVFAEETDTYRLVEN